MVKGIVFLFGWRLNAREHLIRGFENSHALCSIRQVLSRRNTDALPALTKPDEYLINLDRNLLCQKSLYFSMNKLKSTFRDRLLW